MIFSQRARGTARFECHLRTRSARVSSPALRSLGRSPSRLGGPPYLPLSAPPRGGPPPPALFQTPRGGPPPPPPKFSPPGRPRGARRGFLSPGPRAARCPPGGAPPPAAGGRVARRA